MFFPRISPEMPSFSSANDAVTRVHQLRGGGWGPAGMNGAQKQDVLYAACVWFFFGVQLARLQA